MFFRSSAIGRSGFMRAWSTGIGPMRCTSAAWASKAKAQTISASVASRAAATMAARVTVPNAGPMKIAARRSAAPSAKVPAAPIHSPGQPWSGVKRIVSAFLCWWTPAVGLSISAFEYLVGPVCRRPGTAAGGGGARTHQALCGATSRRIPAPRRASRGSDGSSRGRRAILGRAANGNAAGGRSERTG